MDYADAYHKYMLLKQLRDDVDWAISTCVDCKHLGGAQLIRVRLNAELGRHGELCAESLLGPLPEHLKDTHVDAEPALPPPSPARDEFGLST
jgi:hypothetical protein